MRRLQRFGVTPGELERYKMALLRDSGQAAEQVGARPRAVNRDVHRCNPAVTASAAERRHTVRQSKECKAFAACQLSGTVGPSGCCTARANCML